MRRYLSLLPYAAARAGYSPRNQPRPINARPAPPTTIMLRLVGQQTPPLDIRSHQAMGLALALDRDFSAFFVDLRRLIA